MAESDKHKNTEQPESEAQPTGDASGKAVPARAGRAGLAVAVLLSLIAIAGAAYLGYRLELQVVPQLELDRLQSSDAAGEVAALKAAHEDQAQQLQQEVEALKLLLEQQSSELSARVDRSNSEFAEQISAAIESASSSQENLNKQPKEWLIEDIALLLLIGSKQLQLTGDPASVLPIWNVADRQIGRMSDPQLLIARIRVGEEIELLQAMEAVDIEGVSEMLLKLVDGAEGLSLRTELIEPPADESAAADEAANEEDSADESDHIAALWADLKSLVRVQKIGSESALPLNPNLGNELIQQLRLSLLAAQTAALQGNARVYRANLEYVESALEKYFDSEDSSVAEYSETLGRLIHTPIAAQVPDVSGSYKLLQEILDRTPVE